MPFYPVLLLLAALWGGSFLFMRIAVPSLGPVWLIELRVLLAGLVLLPLVAMRGEIGILRREWRALVLMGVLSAAAPFTLLAYSSIALTAGMTSILNATVPLFAVLVALATRSEPVGSARVAGVALGFAGVVVLVGSPHGGDGIPVLSVVTGLVAAFSYVLAANLARRRLGQVPSIVSATGSQLGAAAVLLPLMPLFPLSTWPSARVAAAVIALAILSTSLAFVLYFRLIREAGPLRTLTVTYLIPLFAVAWGYLLLDEGVTPGMLVGGGLILLGVAVANRRQRRVVPG